MRHLPNAVIGRTYRSTHGWELLEEIVDLDRMAGHDGERIAADRLLEALSKAGAREPRVDSFDIEAWWRGESSLEADGRVFDGSHEIIALPNSPSGAVAARIVDPGYGTPDDFSDSDITGNIVLNTRGAPEDSPWVQRWEKHGRSVDGGAVGFILGGNAEGALPPTGHIGYPEESPATIPSVGVSQEVAVWLRRKEPERVSLSVTAQSRQSKSQNVEAVLGPETEEEILVTGHLDAHDIGDGAEDNGLGCATLVEIASLLASVEDQLETKVRFIGFGAEEIGIQGSEKWVNQHDLEDIKAVINTDTAGTGRTLRLKTMGFESLEMAVAEAAENLVVPVEFERQIIPDSDHWPFVVHGIPAATANSVREIRGRGWGHTHGDTLDKLDRRDLRETALILGAGILQLAGQDTDVPRVEPTTIREALPEQYERGLKISGRWPFS